MKTIIIASLLALTTVLTATGQHNVEIIITDLENDNGKIMVELVNENDQSVKQVAAPVSKKKASVIFNDVEAGKYAIRYYHDENGNGKMDTGTFGIPKEGYGFSNDARGFMGPPDFEDMLFEVKADKKLTLKTVN